MFFLFAICLSNLYVILTVCGQIEPAGHPLGNRGHMLHIFFPSINPLISNRTSTRVSEQRSKDTIFLCFVSGKPVAPTPEDQEERVDRVTLERETKAKNRISRREIVDDKGKDVSDGLFVISLSYHVGVILSSFRNSVEIKICPFFLLSVEIWSNSYFLSIRS